MRVVVIGGGPAGVSAALHAAELGAEVTLSSGGASAAPPSTAAPRRCGPWLGPRAWSGTGVRGRRSGCAGRGPRSTSPLPWPTPSGSPLPPRTEAHRRPHSLRRGRPRRRGRRRPFVDAHTVASADGRTWTADRVIIAVGGRAGRLPIPGAELGLTYEDVRNVTALPERVCVIGAADTGCQLTSILADFGCDVTLIEYAPRIVPRADVDVSVALEHAFRGRGIEVITGAEVHQLEALEPGVRVLYRAATSPERSTWTRRSSPSAGPATPTSSTLPPPASSPSAAT